ncbi:MAG: 16S rRNA (cytidine(1402)-2'-O)-methyltransferase [Chromatiales bacterium]|nr:16S rRNA (cytidine(1402)-2'-O)-methyltransferase [Chromatiales bacterium]
MSREPGTLYVVATPIGNLADLSPRARDTLAKADLVAAEDTRHTGQLLTQLGLRRPMLSLHEHNEAGRVGELVERLRAGASIALVSDAGTPLVSDPGYRLVVAAASAGIVISPVPGPSAVLAALQVAGLPTDSFTFAGFLPQRAGPLGARLQALSGRTETLVFFTGISRLQRDLAALAAYFGPARPAAIARELTKLHESVLRGSLGSLADAQARMMPPRGEVVIVVGGAQAQSALPAEARRVAGILAESLPRAQAAALAARITGHKRRALYDWLDDKART